MGQTGKVKPFSDLDNEKDDDEEIEDEKEDAEEEPSKQKNNHSVLFVCLGTTSLLFYNLIINAIDIFSDVTGSQRIGTLLSQVYHFPVTACSLLLCFVKPHNMKNWVILTLSVLVVILFIIPILFLADAGKNTIYWTTLVLSGVAGVASEALYSFILILASQFTRKSTGWLSSGNGLCGVIAFVLRIITKAIFSKSSQLKYSAAIYFLVGNIFYIATLVLFIYNCCKNEDVNAGCVITQKGQKPSSIFSKRTIKVIKKIYTFWLSQLLNFLITLTIFPGYLAAAPQRYGIGTWTPVVITSTFCLFDWLARSLPSYWIWPKTEKLAWIPIVCRLLFFPIFTLSLQKVINVGEPIWTFCWNVLFSITNGYCGTVVMIYGNNTDLDPDDKELAAFLMSFSLCVGIFGAMFLAQAMPTPKN